jgi:hypothetical protein
MSVLRYRLFSEKSKQEFRDILKNNNAHTELDLPYLKMVVYCEQDLSTSFSNLLKVSPDSLI